MAIDSSSGNLKECSGELVVPRLVVGHRYINSGAILAYAYLQRIAQGGIRGELQYRDMSTFLGRSITQCKKYMSELKEAGLIDTKWASREAVLRFVLVGADKK